MVVSGNAFVATVAEIIHIAPVQIMLTLEVWSLLFCRRIAHIAYHYLEQIVI